MSKHTESELEFKWLAVRKFGDETDKPSVDILGGSLAVNETEPF